MSESEVVSAVRPVAARRTALAALLRIRELNVLVALLVAAALISFATRRLQWRVAQNKQGSTQVQVIEDLVSNHVDGIATSVNKPKSVLAII